MSIRPLLFWDVTQRRLVFTYRRFRTTSPRKLLDNHRSHLGHLNGLICLSCTTQTPTLPSLFTSVWYPNYTSPPLNFIVTSSFTFLFLSSVFLSFSPLYFCLLALHVVILPYISPRLRFFPRPIVLFWIYLFNKHIFPCLSFPFAHSANVDALLCLTTESLGHLPTLNVSLQNCTDYNTPAPQPLASTLLAGTTLLGTYYRPYSSLYNLRT